MYYCLVCFPSTKIRCSCLFWSDLVLPVAQPVSTFISFSLCFASTFKLKLKFGVFACGMRVSRVDILRSSESQCHVMHWGTVVQSIPKTLTSECFDSMAETDQTLTKRRLLVLA